MVLLKTRSMRNTKHAQSLIDDDRKKTLDAQAWGGKPKSLELTAQQGVMEKLRPEQRENLLLIHYQKWEIEEVGLVIDRAVLGVKGRIKHAEGQEREQAQQCVGRLAGIYDEHQMKLLYYLSGVPPNLWGRNPTLSWIEMEGVRIRKVMCD